MPSVEHEPGVCPELEECAYGGPGIEPICHTYCGEQSSAIWADIPDTLGWAERNAQFEQRMREELEQVAAS